MLRLIAGLDRDYEGAIVRPPEGRLGMVFQEPRLLPWRSVEDNVRLVAPALRASDLSALFDVLGLAGHRTSFPGELSLGLARRVALARAFAVQPELLLLDEPFVSLDQPLAARLREELAMLVDRRAVITLLVTHDLDEAIGLADRLFLLSARPARILAEIPFATPRRYRTAAEVASIKLQVTTRLVALGQSIAVV
jgi:NitT/TauT family transport system ATP-binding protein